MLFVIEKNKVIKYFFRKTLYVLLVIFMIVISTFGNSRFVALGNEYNYTFISVENTYASPGTTIDVDVFIDNNPGILGAIIEINYDSDLTLVGVNSGSAFESLTMTSPGRFESPCRVTWDALDITENDIKDGVILTLTFNVSSKAELGKECNVGISYINGDIIDYNFESVNATIDNGIIVIGEEILETHNYVPIITQPTHLEDGYITYTCTDCGDSYIEYSEELKAQGHVEAAPVIENRIEATETQNGSYDSVIYCSVCKEELSRENVIIYANGNLTITVLNETALPGDTVSVDISVSNNPGILGAIISLSYDNMLTLTDAISGSAFEKLTMTPSGKLNSPCKFTWDGLELEESDIKDGTILTLVFEVSENAKIGENYNIEVSYIEGDIVDYNMNSVNANIVNGEINISSPVHEHNYTFVTTQPTHLEDGYITYTCTDCGDSYIIYPEELKAQGHIEASPVVENRIEATCTEDGSYDSVVYCEVCNEELSRVVVPIKAQHEVEIIEQIEPDCTNDGLYIYKCIICREIFIEEPEALGHSVIIDPAIPATCTEDGLTEGSHCSVCNEILVEQKVVEATGHSMEFYSSTATCEKNGYEIFMCSKCTETEVIRVNAYGHDYSYQGIANGEMEYICSACDNRKNLTPSETLVIWNSVYINTKPERGSDNQYLEVVKDGIINAKDYALIRNLSR